MGYAIFSKTHLVPRWKYSHRVKQTTHRRTKGLTNSHPPRTAGSQLHPRGSNFTQGPNFFEAIQEIPVKIATYIN
jgi:hypothetical protein